MTTVFYVLVGAAVLGLVLSVTYAVAARRWERRQVAVAGPALRVSTHPIEETFEQFAVRIRAEYPNEQWATSDRALADLHARRLL